MDRLSRRKVLAGTAVLAAAGSGITAVSGLNQVSASGQVDVQSESAFQIDGVDIDSGSDAAFTRVSDNREELQAAIELNNGDTFTIKTDLLNRSDQTLSIRISVNTPTAISVDDIDGGSDPEVDDPVQSGSETFLTKIPSTQPEGTSSADVNFNFSVSDTAAPGSREIGITFEPLSTEET